ncbi:MAG: hypothetical protein C4293_11795 [Nitrospiraceae bacterium]
MKRLGLFGSDCSKAAYITDREHVDGLLQDPLTFRSEANAFLNTVKGEAPRWYTNPHLWGFYRPAAE